MVCRSPPSRFPDFGADVAETPIDGAARGVHNPFADAKVADNEKIGYALYDSRDRLGIPTPQQGQWRQSESG